MQNIIKKIVEYSKSNFVSAICKRTELKCRNKNCVEKKLICDVKDDCGDGTDEEQCGTIQL